ncbi:MAG: hypothetical protein QXK24_03830 [Ignisphaera sp.]
MAYGKHPVWTDGAPWYSKACRRLGLNHYKYRFGDLALPSYGENCPDAER